MNRFNRFAALRWMYNIIVPPRYRDKLNISEELRTLEKAVNKVIEVTNANGEALEAITLDLEDLGAGGYYTPTITQEGGRVTVSFVASNDTLPPIVGGHFYIGDPQTVEEMLQGFSGDPSCVKDYIDQKGGGMAGGYYTPKFEQNGDTITVSFTPSDRALPTLSNVTFTLPKGDKGDTGEPGKSAYEIAVDNGYRGSLTDFFADMRGDKGDNGVTPIFVVEEVASTSWNEPAEVHIDSEDPAHPIIDFVIPQGKRGPGILKVTTSPTSYTQAIGGKNPIKKMSIATIEKEAGFNEVIVGDTIQYGSYLYHIYYLDNTAAYMDTSQYIKGSNGAAGKDGKTPVKGVDYLTDDDSETWTFTLADGTTVTKKVVTM